MLTHRNGHTHAAAGFWSRLTDTARDDLQRWVELGVAWRQGAQSAAPVVWMTPMCLWADGLTQVYMSYHTHSTHLKQCSKVNNGSLETIYSKINNNILFCNFFDMKRRMLNCIFFFKKRSMCVRGFWLLGAIPLISQAQRSPCGRPLTFPSQALHFHDDTSPLTSCSRGRNPILSEHKPAQSESSARWQKHPKASAPMTVCDIRSDSFSITTTTMALCEESVFVSTKQPSPSTEKKVCFQKRGPRRDWNTTP